MGSRNATAQRFDEVQLELPSLSFLLASPTRGALLGDFRIFCVRIRRNPLNL